MKQDNNDTKTRLLLAAVTVFAEKGFSGATIREICQEADANVASVNYHYGDKGKLYKAVLMEIFSCSQMKKTENAGLDTGTPEERLKRYIYASLDEIYQGCGKHEGFIGKFSSVFLMEMANPSPYLDELVTKYMQPDSEDMEKLIQEILGDEASIGLVKESIGMIYGMMLQHSFCGPISERMEPGRQPVREYLQEYGELVYQFAMGGLMAVKRGINDLSRFNTNGACCENV